MGALTSKPFAFTARSWELFSCNTYDYSDTVFSPIVIDIRGNTVTRVLPKIDSNPISEWISDRARFSYDSFKVKPQDKIFMFKFSSTITVFNLVFFFKRFNKFFQNYPKFDISSSLRFKNFSSFVGTNVFYSSRFDFRNSFYFDFYQTPSTFTNLFLIGLNIRYSVPVFSVSIRKLTTSKPVSVFNLGFFSNNLLNEFNVGPSKLELVKFFNFSSRLSRFFFKNFNSSTIFVNSNLNDITVKRFQTTKIYSFFSKPSILSFSELGFSTRHMLSSINFFSPHQFMYTGYNLRNSVIKKFDSAFSSKFYGNTCVMFDLTASSLPFSFQLPFQYTISNIFSSLNFSTYFYDFMHSQNSLNILISLKRYIAFKSTFIYYI
jgi:hypothetical protein